MVCSGVTVLLQQKILYLYAFLHDSNYVTSVQPFAILRYCGQQHSTVLLPTVIIKTQALTGKV
jgi:hypothetical protein